MADSPSARAFDEIQELTVAREEDGAYAMPGA
jgi:hypothetical protein